MSSLPHAQYLRYLMSKRMNAFDIQSLCHGRGLRPPSHDELVDLGETLGPLPDFWEAGPKPKGVKFRRWLRDRGLLPLWQQLPEYQQADRLLFSGPLRRDLQMLVVAHSDVAAAREELSYRYTEAMLPSEQVLRAFCRLYWDIPNMHKSDVLAYLETIEEDNSLLSAVRGDLASAYAALGLQQRITSEMLLQEMVNLGFDAASFARRELKNINAQKLGSLIAASVAGAKAAESLSMLHAQTNGDTDLRRDAVDFLLQLPTSYERIPSIDELDGVIENVEFTQLEASHG